MNFKVGDIVFDPAYQDWYPTGLIIAIDRISLIIIVHWLPFKRHGTIEDSWLSFDIAEQRLATISKVTDLERAMYQIPSEIPGTEP